MKICNRDRTVLEHILNYCLQIEATVLRFGAQYEVFNSDIIYKNAVALCILQIGELAGKLNDEFKEEYNEIPWKQIKAMRNIVAHSYGSIEIDTVWEIVSDDIPILKDYCSNILQDIED